MKKGFTLLELIIAIGIIGVLASSAGFAYTGSLRRARDARRKSDLKQIQTALELYKQEYGKYPISDAAVSANWRLSSLTGPSDPIPWIPQLDGRFITHLPVDPINSGLLPPSRQNAPDVNQAPETNFTYGYVSSIVWNNSGCGLSLSTLTPGNYYILATQLEDINDPEGHKNALVSRNNDDSADCYWPRDGNPLPSNLYILTSP